MKEPRINGKTRIRAPLIRVFLPRLFGISRGQRVGLPNSLGVTREEPEQVRDSATTHANSRRPSSHPCL